MLAQNGHSNNPQEVQEIHPLQLCPWCKEEWVIFLAHHITGKITPIGAFKAEGDVLINITAGTYREVLPGDRVTYTGWLRTRHRETCKQVDKWQGR